MSDIINQLFTQIYSVDTKVKNKLIIENVRGVLQKTGSVGFIVIYLQLYRF